MACNQCTSHCSDVGVSTTVTQMPTQLTTTPLMYNAIEPPSHHLPPCQHTNPPYITQHLGHAKSNLRTGHYSLDHPANTNSICSLVTLPGTPASFAYHPFHFVDFKEQAYICKQPAWRTAEWIPHCSAELLMDFGFMRALTEDYNSFSIWLLMAHLDGCGHF